MHTVLQPLDFLLVVLAGRSQAIQWPVPADRTSMSSASWPSFGSHRVRKSRSSRIKVVGRVF
jgi:hypothetical protein